MLVKKRTVNVHIKKKTIYYVIIRIIQIDDNCIG